MSTKVTHTTEAQESSGLTVEELRQFTARLDMAPSATVVKARVGMRGQIKSLTVEADAPGGFLGAVEIDTAGRG